MSLIEYVNDNIFPYKYQKIVLLSETIKQNFLNAFINLVIKNIFFSNSESNGIL